MTTTARQAAAKVVEIFQVHWNAFRRELKDVPELKDCRDKKMAWTMATAEISKSIYQGEKQ